MERRVGKPAGIGSPCWASSWSLRTFLTAKWKDSPKVVSRRDPRSRWIGAGVSGTRMLTVIRAEQWRLQPRGALPCAGSTRGPRSRGVPRRWRRRRRPRRERGSADARSVGGRSPFREQGSVQEGLRRPWRENSSNREPEQRATEYDEFLAAVGESSNTGAADVLAFEAFAPAHRPAMTADLGAQLFCRQGKGACEAVCGLLLPFPLPSAGVHAPLAFPGMSCRFPAAIME